MSQWHDKRKADLSLSDDKTELHILLESNESGNVYVSVNIADVKELLTTPTEK